MEINVDIFVLLTGHVDVQVLSIFAPSKHFKGLLHYFQCIAQRSVTNNVAIDSIILLLLILTL